MGSFVIQGTKDSCKVIITPDKYSPVGGYPANEAPLVYQGSTAQGTCEFTNPTNHTVSVTSDLSYAVQHVLYYPSSPKQDQASSQIITFGPKETKKLTFALPINLSPQVYESFLSLLDAQKNSLIPIVMFRWTIPGQSGRIERISFDKDYYMSGQTASVRTTVDPSLDLYWRNTDPAVGHVDASLGTDLSAPTLAVIVTDANNLICGKTNYSLATPFLAPQDAKINVPITKDCPDPHVNIKLLNNGAELANGTFGVLSSQASLEAGNKAAHSKNVLLAILGLSALGIVALSIFLFRKRQGSNGQNPPAILRAILFLLFIGAASLYFQTRTTQATTVIDPPGPVQVSGDDNHPAGSTFYGTEDGYGNITLSGSIVDVYCSNYTGSVIISGPGINGSVELYGASDWGPWSYNVGSIGGSATYQFVAHTDYEADDYRTDDQLSTGNNNGFGAQYGQLTVSLSNCDTNISCRGSCSAPSNTCSTNNGSQNNCVYTDYSGGGSLCNQVSAPNQSCTLNNCSSGYQCTSGTCTLVCQSTAPSAFTLSSPSSGSLVNASSTSLSWNAPSSWGTVCSGNANDQYQIHFGTTNTPPVIATQASPTNYTASSLTQGTTYYWDICASNNGFSTETCTSVSNFTVSTLTTDLTANGQQSISQAAPLNGMNLSASTGGTDTGTMNYTFYCNRSDTGTNVTTPWDAKFDGVTDNPKTVTGLCNYSAPGTYHAKVIVERGPWASQDQVVITLTNTPPTVSNLTVDPPSSALFCGSPEEHLSWTFSDQQDGSTQTAYQLQVSNNSNFTNIAFDSGKVTSSSTGIYVPVSSSPGANQLAFNATYFWRVQVYDSANATSGYATGPSFTTPKHPYPQPGFTWSPSTPDVGDTVSFTDQTIFASGSTNHSWLWTIPNASYVDSTTSTTENPHVQFTNTNSSTVILQSTDDVGSCSTPSTPITPRPPLPQFREIQP